MSQDSDGVHEFVQGQMRTALLVACQVGEALARAREARLRELENADRQEAAELSLRLDAERQAAVARLVPATQPGWAAVAPAAELEQVVQEAEQWRSDDPTAEQARREVWDWAKGEGLDFEQMQADIDALRASLLAKQAAELRKSAAERDDPGAEILRMAAEDLQESVDAAAGREETAQPGVVADHEVKFDSVQRRAARAAQLTADGVPQETVDAAMVADLGGALPVAEAVVRAASGRSPAKARPGRRGQSRDSDRSRGR